MDDMTELKNAVEKLQAEMAWVKVMLSGQRPQDVPQRTSPPWVGALITLAVAIIPAIILSKPWG